MKKLLLWFCDVLPLLAGLGVFGVAFFMTGAKFKPTGSETCFVVPNPVYDGETFTITGEHFVPDMNVAAFVGDGGVVISHTNEEGVFEADDLASFGSAGVIQVLVRYECGDSKPWESCDRRARSAATCYFQASGPMGDFANVDLEMIGGCLRCHACGTDSAGAGALSASALGRPSEGAPVLFRCRRGAPDGFRGRGRWAHVGYVSPGGRFDDQHPNKGRGDRDPGA